MPVPDEPFGPTWSQTTTTEPFIYEPDEETLERETREAGLVAAGRVIEAVLAKGGLSSYDTDMIANEIVSMANYFALFIRTGDI